jgi:ferredoxin--NADP+ reductase
MNNVNKWIEGRVVGKHRWTDRLYSLYVDAPVAPFQAGQFGRLALDIEGERVVRSYSFVNAPDEQPLEFYFITVPDGPLTQRLVSMEAGDRLWLAPRPSGLFTLAGVPDGENLWLLSTGTAIGPFISILKTPDPWRRFAKIILVHAVRQVEELSYRDQIRTFHEQHPEQFIMIPFVSREDTDFAIRGRIPDAIADGCLAARTGVPLDAASSQVMICGNPDMVRDTTAVLEGMGMIRNKRREPGQITIEAYW